MSTTAASPPWKPPERPLGCAIIGLGARGASFARRLSRFQGIELKWLADLSQDRLAACVEGLTSAAPRLSRDVTHVLGDPTVEAVFVTVPDFLHRQMAVAAFAAGKHVFLEKPLATTLADALAIIDAWQAPGRVLQLGHVLREAPFYRAARAVVAEGRLGRIHAIRLTDDLGVVHGASYMRRWHRKSSNSGGLMVHKGCHDLDLICWLLDTRPTRVASFGGARIFARPPPAPFCSACPERPLCPYQDTGAYEARTPAEAADPTAFGLDACVFTPEPEIVDNQVVAFELANGARGSFSLAMQNPHGSERTLSVLGENGRLDGNFDRGKFEVFTNDGAANRRWSAKGASRSGHGGGDEGCLRAFLEACLGRAAPELRTAADALRGLVFALAAEEARRRGVMVEVEADLAGFG